MEIPVINRISDFEAGINSLQNPSFLPQVSFISGVESVFQAYSFWKWGALILALLAGFGRIINRIKILIVRFHQHNSLPSKPLHDIDDWSSDSETLSNSSSDEEEDKVTMLSEEFYVADSSYYSQNHDLNLRGRRRCVQEDVFSWSEFANGKNVVKLWDNLGLGLDLNSTSGESISSIFGGNISIPTSSTSSSPLIVTTESGDSRNVALKFWDARVRSQIPAILAEWRPSQLEKIVNVYTGGVEKIYVEGGGAAKLMVGDLRNVSSPLANFMAANVETWWDANVDMDSDSNSAIDGCDDHAF